MPILCKINLWNETESDSLSVVMLYLMVTNTMLHSYVYS